MAAQVKGAVLRGVLRDAKEQHEAGITALLDGVPAAIRTATFATPILHALWYPYEAFGALLQAYLSVVGRGSQAAIRTLGERTAGRDFGSLLKAYAMITSPSRVAAASEKVWYQRFRDAGTTSIDDRGDRSSRFTVHGFREIHPLHCELLTGYGAAVGKRWVATFTVTHDRCIHRGGSECSFKSTW